MAKKLKKHDWFKSKWGFICCRACLIVQNDKNKDAFACKGPSKIVMKAA